VPPPDKDPDAPPGAGVRDLDERLARPPEPPYVPAHPLLEGVWSFPFYSLTLGGWFRLSLYFFIFALIFHALMALAGVT
jgi:hypothetical protein